MEVTGPFLTLAIALGVGMLVGLQRERSPSSTHIGGIRTFPLVTVLGAVSALLAPTFGPWLAVAGFLGVVAAGVLSTAQGKPTLRLPPAVRPTARRAFIPARPRVLASG
jgi:hypothetical protein